MCHFHGLVFDTVCHSAVRQPRFGIGCSALWPDPKHERTAVRTKPFRARDVKFWYRRQTSLLWRTAQARRLLQKLACPCQEEELSSQTNLLLRAFTLWGCRRRQAEPIQQEYPVSSTWSPVRRRWRAHVAVTAGLSKDCLVD